jgi:hypothetical protein
MKVKNLTEKPERGGTPANESKLKNKLKPTKGKPLKFLKSDSVFVLFVSKKKKIENTEKSIKK